MWAGLTVGAPVKTKSCWDYVRDLCRPGRFLHTDLGRTRVLWNWLCAQGQRWKKRGSSSTRKNRQRPKAQKRVQTGVMMFVSITLQWILTDWMITIVMLGDRCTHYTISLSWKAFRRSSFWSYSKLCPPTRQLVPNWPLAHPSETPVFLHCLIHVPVLHSSDLLWCLIPSWLCPPSVRGAARPVMNIQRSAYLTGLSLLSKPLGTILQPQKNTLNGSSSLSLCFSHFPLLSPSLLSLSLWAFTKHIDPPDRGVHLLLFIDYWTETQRHASIVNRSILMNFWILQTTCPLRLFPTRDIRMKKWVKQHLL